MHRSGPPQSDRQIRLKISLCLIRLVSHLGPSAHVEGSPLASQTSTCWYSSVHPPWSHGTAVRYSMVCAHTASPPHPTRARACGWASTHPPEVHQRHVTTLVAASRSGGRVRDTTRTRLSRPHSGPVPFHLSIFLSAHTALAWPHTYANITSNGDCARTMLQRVLLVR